MRVHLTQNVFGVWTPTLGQTRNIALSEAKGLLATPKGSRIKPQNPHKELR